MGIVLHGRGRNRRRNDVAEDVPKTYTVHPIKINILDGILRGPAPLSLGWRVRRASFPCVVVGRARLGMLWGPSSLAFRRGFTRRTLLRDILGLRNQSRNRDQKSNWEKVRQSVL